MKDKEGSLEGRWGANTVPAQGATATETRQLEPSGLGGGRVGGELRGRGCTWYTKGRAHSSVPCSFNHFFVVCSFIQLFVLLYPSSIHPSIRSRVHSFFPSFICLTFLSFVGSSFISLFIQLCVPLFFHPSFIDSFVHSVIPSFLHARMHACAQPFPPWSHVS